MNQIALEKIGPALRRLREAAGRTQKQLAETMGLTEASVSRLEREDGNPRWSSVTRYLNALGCGLGDLDQSFQVTNVRAKLDAQQRHIMSQVEEIVKSEGAESLAELERLGIGLDQARTLLGSDTVERAVKVAQERDTERHTGEKIEG